MTLIRIDEMLKELGAVVGCVLLVQVLAGYLKYMTTIGELIGGEPNNTEKSMQQIIDFEQRLAEVGMVRGGGRGREGGRDR